MMGAAASLNQYVAWYKLLPMLGIRQATGRPPLTVGCPCCDGERLRIYQDTILGGFWHHCPDCLSTGDMISLAARAWKLNLLDTVLQLETLGVEFPPGRCSQEGVAEHASTFPGAQERMWQLLHDSSHAMAARQCDVGRLTGALGLRVTDAGRIWHSRMGRFMGAIDKLTADQAFRPHVKDLTGTTQGKNRLFYGSGWKNVLAVPFQDLPGRICGYLFVGRKGKPEDAVYRPITTPKTHLSQEGPVEAGLSMYANLDGHTALPDLFGNNVFVFDNTMLALKMQYKHLREWETPLPIVGAHSGKIKRKSSAVSLISHGVWASHPQNNYIFWGPRVSAAIFNMAAAADGKVYISHVPEEIRKKTSKDWLLTIQNRAQPWMIALEEALTKLSGLNVELLLAGLTIPRPLFHAFVRTCCAKVQETVTRFEGGELMQQVAFANSKTVSQSTLGWVDEKTGGSISDAILRIDKVFYQEAGDQTFYQGVIIFRDEELPFMEPSCVVEKSTFGWMQKQLIKAGKGVMVSSTAWSAHAIQLATQFHEPEVITGVGRYGWHADTTSFLFPQFQIGPEGNTAPAADAFIVDDLAPCQNIVIPENMDPPDLADLTADTAPNQIFWATVGTIAANVIAPAGNRKIAGIGLVGKGATIIGRMTARTVGCCELPLPTKSEIELCDHITEAVGRHAWPLVLVLPRGAKRRRLSTWLNSGDVQNVVIDVDRFMADALGVQANWRFIVQEEPLTTANAAVAHGAKVLPLWLQHFSKNNFRLQSDATTVIERVLDDIAKWVGVDGDGDVVRNAINVIDDVQEDCTDQAYRFVAMLYRYIDSGTLTVQTAGYEDKTKRAGIIYLTEGDLPAGVFIARATINKLLTDQGIPLPDPTVTTNALEGAGALEREFDYNGNVGWLIRNEWWEERYELCRAKQQHLLKLVR